MSYSCVGGCSTCYDTYAVNASTLLCDKTGVWANVSSNVTANNSNVVSNVIVSEGNLSIIETLASFLPALSMYIGKTFSFMNNKFVSQIIISYIVFLDDLEYYQYHRVNYTQSMNFFI